MLLKNAQILITGGTGSFGKQCVETLLKQYDPHRIIIFSRDEFKQDLMHKQFVLKFGVEKVKKLRFFIGDVGKIDMSKNVILVFYLVRRFYNRVERVRKRTCL